MKLRDYQQAAVESVYSYFGAASGNPIVAIPTAAGKSVIIGELLRKILRDYKGQRIVVASHVKEILEQNLSKLLTLWPSAPAGVYSASLKRKDVGPITFVSIQTVAKRFAEFGHIDLLFIDECHLVGTSTNTQYLKFIEGLRKSNPFLKVVGFTATPYRLGLGMLTDGEIFDDICFDLTERHSFNRLIAEGFLSPLVAKHTQTQLDVSNVGKTGGEFITKELQDAVDKAPITSAALSETKQLAADRKHWLVFASGLEHAHHISEMLNLMGVPCDVISGDLPTDERDSVIRRFKAGQLRAVANFGVLTTGFDYPDIDLIVMLRPTSSPGLWVQMLGRGARIAEGKKDCLVLDFSGNTRRLGPINDPVIPRRKGAKGGGTAPVRLCPNCNTYNHASVRVCSECGYEFPKIIKIDAAASAQSVLADALPLIVEFDVTSVEWHRHSKLGRADSLRIEYICGLRRFKEWVCFEHHGYPKIKARAWWNERAKSPAPITITEALERMGEVRHPSSIRVWVNTANPEVLAHVWAEEKV